MKISATLRHTKEENIFTHSCLSKHLNFFSLSFLIVLALYFCPQGYSLYLFTFLLINCGSRVRVLVWVFEVGFSVDRVWDL